MNLSSSQVLAALRSPAPLTDRQRDIYDWITQRFRATGSVPTVREIGKAFGIKSTNGVNDHLLAIERKGWIGWAERGKGTRGQSRAIRILPVDGCCPLCRGTGKAAA
jgi:SOS-response transcriptional repressor LexA